jgi:hypothetical protein
MHEMDPPVLTSQYLRHSTCLALQGGPRFVKRHYMPVIRHVCCVGVRNYSSVRDRARAIVRELEARGYEGRKGWLNCGGDIGWEWLCTIVATEASYLRYAAERSGLARSRRSNGTFSVSVVVVCRDSGVPVQGCSITAIRRACASA